MSVKTHQFLLSNNYYLRATCFDFLESSSGSPWNQSKII